MMVMCRTPRAAARAERAMRPAGATAHGDDFLPADLSCHLPSGRGIRSAIKDDSISGPHRKIVQGAAVYEVRRTDLPAAATDVRPLSAAPSTREPLLLC
jgi:hypothetical protein